MRKQFFLVIAILFLSVEFGLSSVFALANSGSSFALQTGALGDAASIGNTGVQASIRTHIESVSNPDYDHSFWVGDNLADGSFIQFGYTLMKPGQYCLRVVPTRGQCQISESIESGDARWFWQYWPKANVPNYFYGIGPASSAGLEGTWHRYAVIPNVLGGWNFVLDDRVVDGLNVSRATSKDAAYVVAEIVTGAPLASRSFGPVEFRDLSYLGQDVWHQVGSLKAVSACSVSADCNVPYGVTMLGPNHILVAKVCDYGCG